MTFRTLLDNLHVSEPELAAMLKQRFDPYQISLRAMSKYYVFDGVADRRELTVPNNKMYIIWAMSFQNQNRVPDVRAFTWPYYGGVASPGPYFIWPAIEDGAAPGVGVSGGVVDASYYPLVLKSGSLLQVRDFNWQAGDTITFCMLYTEVDQEDYI